MMSAFEKQLPILDGQAHRQKENTAAAAASATIDELSKDADGELSDCIDHREASSTLGPYLRKSWCNRRLQASYKEIYGSNPSS